MNPTAETKINLIIGDPVEHSLSPEIHNAAYRKLKIDHQYVFLAANVRRNEIKQAVEAVRVFKIRGLTCTMPHKLNVMQYLDEIDQAAQDMNSVNTVVNEKGKLIGYNTDWLGVVRSLKKVESKISGKKAIIFGAGGAARAIIYGLLRNEVEVLVVNRTVSKAQKIKKEMESVFENNDQIRVAVLNQSQTLNDFDFIFNATSVGMEKPQSIVDKEKIKPKHIVFDAVYYPLETKLITEARQRGARVIVGSELLLNQALYQFKLYVGKEAPEKAMRAVLEKNLVRNYQ